MANDNDTTPVGSWQNCVEQGHLTIAVMGATGTGKSTFINAASGSTLGVGNGLRSCTTSVEHSKPFSVDGRRVVLIDTPGFDDTIVTDTDILKMIGLYMASTFEFGHKLSGIIYMHRITDLRMGGTSRKNFRLFRKLCGDKTLKNVIIATNMWNQVEPDIGEARERELATDEILFKPVLDGGATIRRHYGTRESALEILEELVANQPRALLIQEELVEQGKDITETAAAVELDKELMELKKRQGEELKELKEQLAEAKASSDTQTQEELEKAREEMEDHVRKLESSRLLLSQRYAEEKTKAEEELRRLMDDLKVQAESLTFSESRKRSDTTKDRGAETKEGNSAIDNEVSHNDTSDNGRTLETEARAREDRSVHKSTSASGTPPENQQLSPRATDRPLLHHTVTPITHCSIEPIPYSPRPPNLQERPRAVRRSSLPNMDKALPQTPSKSAVADGPCVPGPVQWSDVVFQTPLINTNSIEDGHQTPRVVRDGQTTPLSVVSHRVPQNPSCGPQHGSRVHHRPKIRPITWAPGSAAVENERDRRSIWLVDDPASNHDPRVQHAGGNHSDLAGKAAQEVALNPISYMGNAHPTEGGFRTRVGNVAAVSPINAPSHLASLSGHLDPRIPDESWGTPYSPTQTALPDDIEEGEDLIMDEHMLQRVIEIARVQCQAAVEPKMQEMQREIDRLQAELNRVHDPSTQRPRRRRLEGFGAFFDTLIEHKVIPNPRQWNLKRRRGAHRLG